MKLVDLPISGFADLMASAEPAPGGGSAAALEGALGAGLTAMVCALTKEKKQFAEFHDLSIQGEKTALSMKDQFLDLVDRDTEAFNAVSAVFSMPKDTDGEKAARSQAMQAALKGCVKTPMEMMGLSLRGLELIETLMGKVNPNTASDLGVGALSLKAAIQGAWLNVLINVGGIRDEAFVSDTRKAGEDLLAKALPLADRLYAEILGSL